MADPTRRQIMQMADPCTRFGSLPAPPAAGEVAELVEWLSDHAAHLRRMQEIGALSETELPERLDRAAELLQQRHPEPVPVAERPWEREGWCDEQGWCWCFFDNSSERGWQYRRPQPSFYDTHCLPHYALPLPAGEVRKEEIVCETCEGLGTIDERLGGYGDSNPAATCPDCDGIGVIAVPANALPTL